MFSHSGDTEEVVKARATERAYMKTWIEEARKRSTVMSRSAE